MRVCIIRNADGEMNAQMERVATALAEAGHTFFYVTRARKTELKQTVVEKEFQVAGRKIKNYEIQIPAITGGGLKNLQPLYEYGKLLKEWLNANNQLFDTIHAIDYDAGSVALKVANKYNKKLVYHIADFYAESRLGIPGPLRKIIAKKELKLIGQADATIVCSEDRIEQIKGSYPKKLIVVHNTPAREQVIAEEDIKYEQKNQLTVTYVGGIEKKRFINQAVEVIAKHPDIQLKLAGAGDVSKEVEHYAEEADNIRYYGSINYQDALNLYESTDFMFAMYDPNHPNHKYSAANKVYEAQLMGKAIIVAAGTGMDKIVAANNMGYVIDYSQEAFSEILTHIVGNQEELYEKRVNAHRAYPLYSWDEMKRRIIELYQDI